MSDTRRRSDQPTRRYWRRLRPTGTKSEQDRAHEMVYVVDTKIALTIKEPLKIVALNTRLNILSRMIDV